MTAPLVQAAMGRRWFLSCTVFSFEVCEVHVNTIWVAVANHCVQATSCKKLCWDTLRIHAESHFQLCKVTNLNIQLHYVTITSQMSSQEIVTKHEISHLLTNNSNKGSQMMCAACTRCCCCVAITLIHGVFACDRRMNRVRRGFL